MVLEQVVGEGAEVLLIKDCVEASGSFVLHWLLKRYLGRGEDDSRVVFVALGAPYPHYARIARKQGCNLVSSMENGHLAFIDVFSDPNSWKYSCTAGVQSGSENALFLLYKRIREAVRSGKGSTWIMFDDVSLLEVLVQGSKSRVLDFLQYCRALTCEASAKRCSIVMMVHEDIYEEDDESSVFLLDLEQSSNVVIKVQALSTGLATDVHGQLDVVYRDTFSAGQKNVRKQFKITENSMDFFAPGQRLEI